MSDIEQVVQELKRIADALEQGNTRNQEWIELNKQWHEEGLKLQEQWHNEAETLNELRYQERLDLDRQVFLYQRECHDEAERLNEKRFQEHNKREHAMMQAYLSSLIAKAPKDDDSQ